MVFLLHFKLLNKMNIICILWLFFIGITAYLENNSNIYIHNAIKLIFLLEYGSLFISGIFFYKLRERHFKILSLSFLILIFSSIISFYLYQPYIHYIIVYYILFFMFALGKCNFLKSKILIFIGTISYSLYLIHQLLGYVIIDRLESHNLNNSATIILIPLFICITISFIMWKYIEIPGNKFIRSFFSSRF
jgi:peptidoglycan/LPS O-acetylase OafA/YrhL